MVTRAQRSSWGWVVVLVCAATASSCGSDGGSGATCGTVSPCGGDPTGTWKFTASCSKLAMDVSAVVCPDAEVEPGALVASGTIALNADQTYAFSLTQTGTVKVDIPATCLTQQGFALPCAQAGPLLALSLGADSPFTSVACTGKSDCSCTFGISVTAEESGTWGIANGTSLLLETASGDFQSDDFCVQGSKLHITNFVSLAGGAQGRSDVVAVKQ